MDSTNEWQMGKDYYDIVGMQLKSCLIAQSMAKEDTTQYDEWFDEITKLDTLTGNLFNKKDQPKRKEWRQQVMKELRITETYNFNLDLTNNAKMRFQIHETMLDWQNWLIRKSHENNLLIRQSTFDYNGMQSRI